jgi:hypothetical protein
MHAEAQYIVIEVWGVDALVTVPPRYIAVARSACDAEVAAHPEHRAAAIIEHLKRIGCTYALSEFSTPGLTLRAQR